MPRPLIVVPREILEPLIRQELSFTQIAATLKHGVDVISRSARLYGLVSAHDMRTAEGRAQASKRRRAWCAANPDKHPWKRHDKFKSVPCAKLKEWLTSKDVQFAGELLPLEAQGRFYSIDVAFPDRMIGIEVNGNQHYNVDGTLKPYYQQRHDLIEQAGWKLYELHYTLCFKPDKLEQIIPPLLESPIKVPFDYQLYVAERMHWAQLSKAERRETRRKAGGPARTLTENEEVEAQHDVQFQHETEWKQMLFPIHIFCRPRTKKTYACTVCGTACGEPFNKGAPPRCVKCCGIASRKVQHPSREELEKMVWERPTIAIAAELGVSDKAIAAWCKHQGVSKPPPGYWNKRASGQTHEGALSPVTPQPKKEPAVRPVTTEDETIIRQMVADGVSYRAMETHTGLARGRIRRFCIKAGLDNGIRRGGVEVADGIEPSSPSYQDGGLPLA